jgi:septal ring factor EnvC (AmiA/AmiB activator)
MLLTLQATVVSLRQQLADTQACVTQHALQGAKLVKALAESRNESDRLGDGIKQRDARIAELQSQLAASQASVTQHACECARLQSDDADLRNCVAEYSARVSADDGRTCDLEAALAECHREQIARIKPAGHDCNCAVFQQDSLLAICSCGRQNAAPLGIPAGDCGRGVSTLAGCSGEGDKQLFGG